MTKQQLSLWISFVLVSALTLFVDARLWGTPSYWLVLGTLAALSLSLAIGVLIRTRPKRWPVPVVLAVLVVGQWWLIQHAAAFTAWGLRGFAP